MCTDFAEHLHEVWGLRCMSLTLALTSMSLTQSLVIARFASFAIQHQGRNNIKIKLKTN